jgi:hypothetical protein
MAASLEFPGSADYISVGDNNLLDGSTAITIMCFARIESIIDTNSNTVLNKLNQS